MDGAVDRASALERLHRLENVGLVEELASALPDFNAYVVTAKGLGWKRKLDEFCTL